MANGSGKAAPRVVGAGAYTGFGRLSLRKPIPLPAALRPLRHATQEGVARHLPRVAGEELQRLSCSLALAGVEDHGSDGRPKGD